MIRVAFGWIGRRGSPAGVAKRAPERPVGVERTIGLDLGIDPQVADPAGGGRQPLPDGCGEGADRVGRPVAGDRAARGVGEAPRHRSRPADEDLGADLRRRPRR